MQLSVALVKTKNARIEEVRGQRSVQLWKINSSAEQYEAPHKDPGDWSLATPEINSGTCSWSGFAPRRLRSPGFGGLSRTEDFGCTAPPFAPFRDSRGVDVFLQKRCVELKYTLEDGSY
jgi:hypothetical protein